MVRRTPKINTTSGNASMMAPVVGDGTPVADPPNAVMTIVAVSATAVSSPTGGVLPSSLVSRMKPVVRFTLLFYGTVVMRGSTTNV